MIKNILRKNAFFMAQKTRKLNQIMQALVARDKEDAQMDAEIRANLLSQGMTVKEPRKVIEIDTGEVIRIENVVDKIISEVEEDFRFISLEGSSGSGKSTTTDALAERLAAIRISNGEVFRFLTHKHLSENAENFEEILSESYYKLIEEGIQLFHQEINVTKDLFNELRDLKLEPEVPRIGKRSQKEVIEFIEREVKRLNKDLNKKVLIEGRAFALDFLPSDLRIKLKASPRVRAARRAKER